MRPGKLQQRIISWLGRTYGQQTLEKEERSLRYAEESMELLQAAGVDRETLLKIVDHVYSRPKGEVDQEVTGSYITLVGMCHAHGIDLHRSVDRELDRVEQIKDACRTKHDSKPEFMRTHSSDVNAGKIQSIVNVPRFGKELTSLIHAIDYPDNYIQRISELYGYLIELSKNSGLFYTPVEASIDFDTPVTEAESLDGVLRQPIRLNFINTICTDFSMPNSPYRAHSNTLHVETYSYGAIRGIHRFEPEEPLQFRTPVTTVTLSVSKLLELGCRSIRIDLDEVMVNDHMYNGASRISFCVS